MQRQIGQHDAVAMRDLVHHRLPLPVGQTRRVQQRQRRPGAGLPVRHSRAVGMVVEPKLHGEQLTSPGVGVANSIGRPVRRREDARILSGRSRYLDDIALPDTLHMAFVRSPHAHARVISVEGARWTAAEIAGRAVPGHVAGPPGLTVEHAPHPLLADGEVRYVGQPVAAVVAESRALAEDAADARGGRVRAARAGGRPARRGDAGALGEARGRRRGRVRGRRARRPHRARDPAPGGGADGAARRARGARRRPADRVVVVAERAPPARAARADPRPRRGVDPRASCRTSAARSAPRARSRWRRRWSRSRRSSSAGRSSGPRTAARTSCRRRRGAGCAPRSSWRSTPTAGSWPCAAGCSPTSARTCCRARRSRRTRPRCCSQGCYDIPAVEVFVTGARTNKVPTGPYRGAGRPEASYLIETTLDAAARELGIDPVELRRRNLVRSFPYRTALGWTYDSGDFERCLDRAVELIAEEPEAPGAASAATGRRRHAAPRPGALRTCSSARGVALSVERSGGLFECAEIHVDDGRRRAGAWSARRRPGRATRRCSRRSRPSKLGVDPERVTVRTGDTDALADGVGSFASRTTAMGGSAVAAAADDLLANGGVGRPRALRVRPGLRQRCVRGRRSRSTARPARCASGGSSPSTTRAGS